MAGPKARHWSGCDKFPRGSHEMQSWRRKARICKNILTARQRLDESLRGAPTTLARWGWSTRCWCPRISLHHSAPPLGPSEVLFPRGWIQPKKPVLSRLKLCPAERPSGCMMRERDTGTQTGCCSCEPGPMRATSIVLEASTAYHCNAARLDDTHHGSRSVWLGRPGLARAAAGRAQIMARMAGGELDRWCSEGPHQTAFSLPQSAHSDDSVFATRHLRC